MALPEKKIKHLEMIEAIIERMAKNSFQLKGWAMTLVAAVGTLASQGSDGRYIVLVFLPIIGFWILDAFYVQQERKYKLLYKNVVGKSEDQIDFNMDTGIITGTTDEMKRLCFCNCMFSVSVIWIYPIIAIAMLVLIVGLKVF